MNQVIVVAVRAVLAASFAGAVGLQALLTWAIVKTLTYGDAVHPVEVAVLAAAVLCLGLLEVVLVSVWRLLTMARRGTVFTAPAFRWVDAVIGAAALASAALVAVGVLLAPEPDSVAPPGAVLLLGGAALLAAGLALVVYVMRALLAQAIAREQEARELRAELEDVF